MTLRVVIADDEALARLRLRQFLAEEPSVEIVSECATGPETLQAIQRQSPDLVFLDVRMPGLDGFEVVQALAQDRMPAIIFVTAHDRFALRAFEARAMDFLLKPFSRERLQEAVRRARALAKSGRHSRPGPDLAAVFEALKARPQKGNRIEIRSGGRISFVKPDQIDWIRSADNYTELHVGSAVHLVRGTLAALLGRLAPDRFARISRSLAVNVNRIKELRTKSHGDYAVVLLDGRELSGSRNRREALLRLLEEPG